METTQEIYNIHYNHYLEFNNTLRNQQSVLKLSQIVSPHGSDEKDSCYSTANVCF